MKRFVLSLACAVVTCAVTCPVCYPANDFFGIQVKGGDANFFTISGYSGSEVKYKDTPGKTNSDIYAWGKLGDYTIDICLTNGSSAPISMNYFGDTFTLISADNKTYYLDKGQITSYPSCAYINPDETKCFSPRKPKGIKNRNDIKLILCDLGAAFDRTMIVLKPLPEIEERNPRAEQPAAALTKDLIKTPSDLALLSGRKRIEIDSIFGPPIRKNTYDINGEAVTFFFDLQDVCSGYAR